MKTIPAVLAALAAATAAAPAAAQDQSRVVRHGDLDLSRPADEAKLRKRVALAVEAVCGSYAGVRPDDVGEVSACRRRAEAGAEVRIARRLGERARVAAR